MERAVALCASSSSPADTARLAAAVAANTATGDVVVLGGELGAGKTAFTKAFCAALGITETVTSPTFTLAQRYQSDGVVVHHLDVYRLEQLDEVVDLALPELFDSGGIVVIEWGDTIGPALPASYLLVRLAFGEGADDRELRFEPVGTAWQARLRALRESLGEEANPC